MEKKSSRFSLAEEQYIRENFAIKTDEEMADHLKRSILSIRKKRRQMKLSKDNRTLIKGLAKVDIARGLDSLDKVSRDKAREHFFKEKLENSLYYENLKQQFTEDEIKYYLEEWGSLCLQFEDIVATERRQIDEFIKLEIMGNRIQRNIRITEDEVIKLQKEIENYRNTNDMTDEQYQERDAILMSLTKSMMAQSDAMTNDYNKNLAAKNSLLNELNARRRDRVDQIKKSGTTFLGLVTAFRDRELRESQGKYAELMRLSKEKKKAEWRKLNRFPDGTNDFILLDSESNLEDLKEKIDEKSSFIIKYKKSKDKKILLIENDDYRVQFFQHIFQGNKIDIVSSFEKLEPLLKSNEYDLICFDYDLGTLIKGDVAASLVYEKRYSPNADILIHSMNDVGADSIYKILEKRNVERLKFDVIFSDLKGEQNATVN